MSFWDYQPYVSVASRRAQAAREVEKLKKKNRDIAPVVVEGRKIATSVWGKAWCDNLERYSDYASRLPRGRSYVRNGSVIDLSIARGQISALVSGSDIYQVKIEIAVAAPPRWKAICADCAGSVGSLVDLLRGKLSKSVMERVCRDSDGLFPAPKEIKLSCSCPDWADMCKHVAAVLYGVGARLDAAPEMLFALRGVDHADLVSTAGSEQITRKGAASERVLGDVDVAALFGLDMAPSPAAPAAPETSPAARAAPSDARTRAPARKPKGQPLTAIAASPDLQGPAARQTRKAVRAGEPVTARAGSDNAVPRANKRVPKAPAKRKVPNAKPSRRQQRGRSDGR
jgi:uncharacterized Zn finger protein